MFLALGISCAHFFPSSLIFFCFPPTGFESVYMCVCNSAYLLFQLSFYTRICLFTSYLVLKCTSTLFFLSFFASSSLSLSVSVSGHARHPSLSLSVSVSGHPRHPSLSLSVSVSGHPRHPSLSLSVSVSGYPRHPSFRLPETSASFFHPP